MKSPIISVFITDKYQYKVFDFVKRLKAEGFNPFVSTGEPRIYCQVLAIQEHGGVYICEAGENMTNTVATIYWETPLEPDEMEYARRYYCSYYKGEDYNKDSAYKWMDGNGYFSPPPMARQIGFEELLEQMQTPKKEKRSRE